MARPILAHLLVIVVTAAALGCEARKATGGAPAAPQTCDGLVEVARRALASFDTAHDGCVQNADCAMAQGDGACTGWCATPIAKTAMPAREALRAQLNAGPCAEYSSRGCSPSAVPSCLPSEPVCANGRCRYGKPP